MTAYSSRNDTIFQTVISALGSLFDCRSSDHKLESQLVLITFVYH